MTALFIPFVRDSAWVDCVLPDTSPAELPVAGRLFVDYAAEAAMHFAATSADVLDARFSQRLVKRFATRQDGLLSVSYRNWYGTLPDGLLDLEGRPEFTREAVGCDGLAVMWGLSLPLYGPGEAEVEPVPEDAARFTPAGIYHYRDGRWFRPKAGVASVRDCASWLDLTMRLLRGEGRFTLPGYSAESGAHLCRNVVLEHGADVQPPVLLLDNSRCGRNVRLRGGVVLGRNSFVGESTVLERTMVCDDTVVGEGLELNGKIVVGTRIVDAATGTWADIEESALVRPLDRFPAWMSAIAKFLAGASHGRRR